MYRFQWVHKADHFLKLHQVGTKADVQEIESQAKAEAQRTEAGSRANSQRLVAQGDAEVQRLQTEAEMKRTRSA